MVDDVDKILPNILTIKLASTTFHGKTSSRVPGCGWNCNNPNRERECSANGAYDATSPHHHVTVSPRHHVTTPRRSNPCGNGIDVVVLTRVQLQRFVCSSRLVLRPHRTCSHGIATHRSIDLRPVRRRCVTDHQLDDHSRQQAAARSR